MMTKHVLGIADVGEILKLSPETITRYMRESRGDGRYVDHPFPAPDGRVSNSPYWLPVRVEELRNWRSSRPGRGVGGGRPAHHV
jgi:hypothetical protein